MILASEKGHSVAHVMGIAVVDGQVASVVRDEFDNVVATNAVDIGDESPATIVSTVVDLVTSVPFEVSRIGLVAADPNLVNALRGAFAPAPNRPDWYPAVTVDVLDTAIGQLARTDPALSGDRTGTGSVAVVNLDEYTAPTAGIPIMTVDPRSGAVTGAVPWQPGFDEPTAVLDPSGAANVAGVISSIPGSESISHVVFTGSGADVPGVHAAFEQALGRPVVVAAQPRFAIAGAAAGIARAGGSPASGTFPAAPPASGSFAVAPSGSSAVQPSGTFTAYSAQSPVGGDDSTTTIVDSASAAGGYSGGAGGYTDGDDGTGQVAVAPVTRTPADRRNRRRWWLVGGTAVAGMLILGGAIAAVLLSTGTAQRVVGVTTVSVTTETATHTVTRMKTQTQTNTDTHTVTPPTETRTVTRTTTRPPTTVTETVTEYPDGEEGGEGTP